MVTSRSKLWPRTGRILLALFLLLNIVAITQAYHLTHFYEQGTVKTIEEQTNSVWGQAQVALIGLKQQKLAVGAVPDSPYTELKLRTNDGITLDAWLVKVQHSRGTILLFHGHGSEKSANLTQSNTFNEWGFSTLLVDFRAHGQSTGNTCTIGYREAEDVRTAYAYIQKTGEQNIILYGISLGAATITKAIAEYDLKPARLILEMPFASLPGTVEGKMRMAGLPAEPLAALLTFWGGTINGFWAFNMQPQEFVKKIHCPVLLQWGEKDKGVLRSHMETLFNNIPGEKKWVVYANSGHENLCENEPEKWEANVEDFLEQGSK